MKDLNLPLISHSNFKQNRIEEYLLFIITMYVTISLLDVKILPFDRKGLRET